jgi:phosphoenolpyruvate synthase/pyruvate phosphate dikinase
VDELFSLFDGIVLNWQMIRERYQKGFVTIFSSEGVKLFRADDYKAEGWDRNFFQDVQMVKDVKGTTAYRGVVKGVVRVLKTVADIAQFQVGEILVANQTTPEYVPAMKKAAAMVTDQGGITCHAAIVSRELKIPTVIGTKVATQVLKDGDVVEVDAEKGIVSLLSSS